MQQRPMLRRNAGFELVGNGEGSVEVGELLVHYFYDALLFG